VCIRLQLWRSAGVMIGDSPWFGAGRTDTFNDVLQTQAASGRVSARVASGFGEPHNDMLQMLTGLACLAVLRCSLFTVRHWRYFYAGSVRTIPRPHVPPPRWCFGAK